MAKVELPGVTQEAILDKSAKKYHIPLSVLWGVYGVETAHGTNVTTSSAGAKGPFQFIEGTAKQYNVPWNNDVNAQALSQSSEGAAHYLSDLYKQHGSWDAALKAYSGGGYGWSQVAKESKAKLSEKSYAQEVIGRAESLAKPLEAAATVTEATAKVASQVLKWVDEPLTPLKFIGGAVLVYVGVRGLSQTGAGRSVSREGGQASAHALELVSATTLAGRGAQKLKRPKAA